MYKVLHKVGETAGMPAVRIDADAAQRIWGWRVQPVFLRSSRIRQNAPHWRHFEWDTALGMKPGSDSNQPTDGGKDAVSGPDARAIVSIPDRDLAFLLAGR
jgi:hypothetical protein